MGVPLDPFYEQAYRTLLDALQQSLGGIRAERGDLTGQYGVDLARLGTNQNIDTRHLNAGLVSHGLFNSGIRTTDTNRLDTSYDRQRQDATFSLERQLGALDRARSEAYTSFRHGVGDARLDSARRLANDPYAVLPHYGKNPPRRLPHLPKKPPNRRP